MEKKNVKVNFEIDVDSLSSYVENNVFQGIEERVSKRLEDIILKEFKEKTSKIEKIVDEKIDNVVKDFIKDIYENKTIKVATNNRWNDVTVEEVVLQDLVMEKLRKITEDGKIEFTPRSSYSNKEYMTIAEYIKSKYLDESIETKLKSEVEKQMKTIKNQIETNLKSTFDSATKSMLTDQVMQILMQSETYRKISTNVSALAFKDNANE